MSGIHVRAGAWYGARPYVKAGAWYPSYAVAIKTGGAWQWAFEGASWGPADYTMGGTGALTANLRFLNTGVVDFTNAAGTQVTMGSWLKAGNSASAWDVYVQSVSGAFSAGDPMNTWLNLGTTRSFQRSAGAGASQTVTFNLYFRPSTGAFQFPYRVMSVTRDRT